MENVPVDEKLQRSVRNIIIGAPLRYIQHQQERRHDWPAVVVLPINVNGDARITREVLAVGGYLFCKQDAVKFRRRWLVELVAGRPDGFVAY